MIPRRLFAASALVLLSSLFLSPVVTVGQSPTDPVEKARNEIRAAFGRIPTFLEVFPPAGLPGAWEEMKAIQLNPNSALTPREKELIGLAVAAQIPCSYCVYFHTAAARQAGASDAQIKEAVALAAVTRHWSTVLNGSDIDLVKFKKETDQILRYVSDQAAKN